MKTLYPFIASLAIVLFLGACETTTSSSQSKADADDITLSKGMSVDEVRNVMGEPLSIKKEKMPEGILETWVYEKTRHLTTQDASGTREVPYVDAITRESRTRIETVLRMKTVQFTLTTNLFIFNGYLRGWKQSTSESSNYDN